MRRARQIILFGGTGSASGSAGGGSDAMLVVAGQSNALGFGLSAADVPAPLQASNSKIKIWNGSAFATLVNGTNNDLAGGSQNWGPEAQFALLWALANPNNTLYIVKYAVGGTPLAAAAGSDWSPSSSGELFSILTTHVNNAKAALGVSPPVTAILWMQGESDSSDTTQASNYQTNLTSFASTAISTWGDVSTKFIIGRIPDITRWQFRRQVRAAQKAVGVLANRKIVDTDDYPLQSDSFHYTAAGQVSLGADMYAAYAGSYTFAPKWSPTLVNDLVAHWCDAADLSAFTLSGSSVTQWNDKGENLRNLSQATAGFKPLRNSAVIGSKHGVVFDGVDDTLNTISFSAAQPISVFSMIRTGAALNTFAIWYDGGTSGTRAILFARANSVADHATMSGGTLLDLGVTLSFDTNYISSAILNGASSQHAFNGGTPVSGNAGTAGVDTNGIRLSENIATNFYTGAIGEIITYAGAANAALQAQFEGYLAHKFGQTALLPGGHTYKSSPPLE